MNKLAITPNTKGPVERTGCGAPASPFNTPEKRRHLWAMQACMAAFIGNEREANRYAALADAEDAKCAVPLKRHNNQTVRTEEAK